MLDFIADDHSLADANSFTEHMLPENELCLLQNIQHAGAVTSCQLRSTIEENGVVYIRASLMPA